MTQLNLLQVQIDLELQMKAECKARSSHRSCSVKKSVLKKFANFTGNFRPATLLKRDSNTGVFL